MYSGQACIPFSSGTAYIPCFASNYLGAEVTMALLSRTSNACHVVAGGGTLIDGIWGWVALGHFFAFHPACAAYLGSLVSFSHLCLLCLSTHIHWSGFGVSVCPGTCRLRTGRLLLILSSFLFVFFFILFLFISFPSHLRRRH